MTNSGSKRLRRHGELYAILWSLAMESAALQDAAAAAADPASAP
jgi:hypothetical protein